MSRVLLFVLTLASSFLMSCSSDDDYMEPIIIEEEMTYASEKDILLAADSLLFYTASLGNFKTICEIKSKPSEIIDIVNNYAVYRVKVYFRFGSSPHVISNFTYSVSTDAKIVMQCWPFESNAFDFYKDKHINNEPIANGIY